MISSTIQNRSLPVDLTEKMNKMRDALVQARTLLTAQQSRATQLTSELARVKQSRISTDLTGSLTHHECPSPPDDILRSLSL